MKVVIIGGGLIGVTTAYALNRRGHAVTVIEREDGPGRQTSFANGAMLTPSMSDPWNAPGSWRTLLTSLGRSDAPLQLRIAALPSLARWGIGFLRNSATGAFHRNTLKNLRLTLSSLEAMRTIRERTGIEYGQSTSGTLRVFRDGFGLDQVEKAAGELSLLGLKSQRLSVAETVALEPALLPIARRLVGGLYYPGDEIGNAYRFCVGLADIARGLGVDFRYGVTASSLEVRDRRVCGVACEDQSLVADFYIVAAGSYSTPFLSKAGIYLPVQPAKGYSITFEQPPQEASLRIPIVDDGLHAIVVPVDGAIRVAGTAEFAGYDLSLPPARISNLHKLLKEILPDVQFNSAAAKAWCGLRAMSMDGVPIIGVTPLSNLLVNTGHGHLGWTMAAGSAELIANIICGTPTSIDSACYSLSRFAVSQ